MNIKNVLVVGVGAIGGVCAALIAKAGYALTVVCKHTETAQKIQTQGLKISGIRGAHTVKMQAVATCAELGDNKYDLVLLATKATDMLGVATELLPLLRSDSVVVSLQNGICEEQLAEVLGRERVVACVVGWGATMHEAGVLEMTSEGEFVIGNIDHQPDARLPFIQKILELVVPVSISNQIYSNLYSKLIINSCITTLGAICGLYLGEMLNQRKIRNIFLGIMREAIQVADAMNLKVEPYANKLDYYKLLASNSLWARFKQHLTVWVIGRKYKLLKSSSLQSLERRRPTEIDYLNGFICQKGRELGVKTPLNDWAVQTIKQIEQGQAAIGVHHFANVGI